MVDFSSLGATEWKDLDVARLVFFTSIATLIDNTIMYPWWSLKTRQQVERGEFKSLSHTIGKGGVIGLYKGFTLYAVASMPAYVIYVTSYTYSKSALGFSYSQPSGWGVTVAPLAAGVIADAACLGFYVPIEIVTQRLQLPGRYKGPRDAVTSMWREEGGIRAFYRGFGATLITSGVSSGIWWLSYENLKKGFTAAIHDHGVPSEDTRESVAEPVSGLHDVVKAVKQSLPHMLAGFCSGGLAAIASNPFDVAKTRLQTQTGSSKSFAQGLRRLVVEEGVKGAFLRGIVPKLVTMAPLGIINSVMYESILYLSRKEGPANEEDAQNLQIP